MEQLLRVSQIIGDVKKGVPVLVPISRATLWHWVKIGKFPAPIKLGAGVTCWKMSDVQQFIDSASR